MGLKVIYNNKVMKTKAYNVSNGTVLVGDEWVKLNTLQIVAK